MSVRGFTWKIAEPLWLSHDLAPGLFTSHLWSRFLGSFQKFLDWSHCATIAGIAACMPVYEALSLKIGQDSTAFRGGSRISGKGVHGCVKEGGLLCWFYLIFLKYPMKMKQFGLSETKILFHFHGIFKNWRRSSSEPPLDPPLTFDFISTLIHSVHRFLQNFKPLLKTGWIKISWLHKEPADQDLHCFSSSL